MSDSGREWPSERGGPPMRHPIPEDLPSEFYGLWTTPMHLWSPTEGRLTLERIARLEAELREAKERVKDMECIEDSQHRAVMQNEDLRAENATLRATVAELRAKEPQ